MARFGAKKRASAFDLEEIAVNRFMIHNPQVRAFLKGEGEFKGQLFELMTWRRDGLLARIRARGFEVRTLDDLVARLPGLPPPPPIGNLGWRPLVSAIEQFSHFDLHHLRWHILKPQERDGVNGVAIYAGWVLRRRKGRGAASFYLALGEQNGGIGLRALDEEKAILSGYAQAGTLREVTLVAERYEDGVLLPNVEVPPVYRTAFQHIATATPAGLKVGERGWELARKAFERLGVRLLIGD
jgi:hypothetical protein